MPTYDYKCEHCNNTFEFFQSMKDDPMTLCPECGHNALKKLVSMPAGLIFKGTGFYLTDYAKKKTAPSTSSGSTSTDSTSTVSDSKATEDKPAKKENKSSKDK
ncbi:MAG: FmdB family zinc ribbon protein [Ignavibacteria bacterium]